MKILSLNIKNIKRIKAVEIDADGKSVITLSGKNAQGKSSVLDSIIYAFGGAATIPSDPVRKGDESGDIVVRTDDYYIMRNINSDGKTVLKVFPADDKMREEFGEFRKPQELLNSIIGRLSFDPLEFIRAKDKTSILKSIVGLDFKAIDTAIADIMEDRRRVNVKIRDLQSYNKEIHEPELNLPDEEINTEKLMKSLEEEQRIHEQRNVDIKKGKEISDRLEEIEKEREKLKAEAQKIAKALAEPLPDISITKERLGSATEINKKIQLRNTKSNIQNQIGDLKITSDNYTESMKELAAKKTQMIKDSKFPIKELSISDKDKVLYKGFPLEQASGAERILVGLAIGAALNPKLKVILIKDVSLLDEDNIKVLKNWAEEKDYQIWLEDARSKDEDSIIIEDGTIKLTSPQNEEVI